VNNTIEGIPTTRFRFDESYWPAGSSEVMRRWLAETYDPKEMPRLVTSRRGDEHYVLGWERRDYDLVLLLVAHHLLGHPDDDSDPCGFTFAAEEGDE
jgi:hypothetical protein